jgi:hypothetical protein
MYYAGVIRARRYIGVDLDQEKLRAGKAEHPNATAILGKVEELAPDVSGDIVLCLQCIGVNKHFENRQALQFVQRIIKATRPGGALVFNLGPKVAAHLDEIDKVVRGQFASCRRFDYGRFHKPEGHLWALPLARLMRAAPNFAKSSAFPAQLYICERRGAG